MTVDGTTPGSDYSQTQVTGNINLGGANLDVSSSSTGTDGDPSPIVLIRNLGSNHVTGTFNGLLEGAAVSVAGVSYQITYDYRGIYGDGPDVALVRPGTVVVDSSLSDSVYGQPITLQATVCGETSSGALPTGTVTFYDGTSTTPLDVIQITALTDQVSFTTSALAVGDHAITAYYSGDSNFPQGTSPIYSQQVVATPVAIAGASTVNAGMPYTLDLSTIGPVNNPITSWTINWGDESQTISDDPATVEHIYTTNNSYTITASATDGVTTYNATVSEGTAGSQDNGFSFTSPAAACYGFSAMTVQPDGKIVAAGPGPGGGVFVARYNVNGSEDVQFAPSGLTSVAALAVEPMDDGSYDILVAGMAAGGFSVVRYNMDGSLDTSFVVGPGDSVFDNHSFTPCRIAVQSSGEIVVAGFVSLSGSTDLGMVSYNSDGSLNTSFGDAGGWLTAGLSVSTEDPVRHGPGGR